MAVGFLALPAAEARGQETEAEAAFQVVEDLFDAMRAKDVDALRGVFMEGARLMTTTTGPDGAPAHRLVDMEDFAQNIGAATVHIDEQIWDEEITVHDNLAHVWVKYAMFIDENFSHCGVDSFQLFRSTEGWKIFHLADTQRREDCWMPPN